MNYSKEFIDSLLNKGLASSDLSFIELMGVGYYYMKKDDSLSFFNCYTNKSCSCIYQGSLPIYTLCSLLNEETAVLLKSHTEPLTYTCLSIHNGPWDKHYVFISSKIMALVPRDAHYILNIPDGQEIKEVLFKDENQWSLYLDYKSYGLLSYVYLESDSDMVLSYSSNGKVELLLNININDLGIKVFENTHRVCKEVETLVKEVYKQGGKTVVNKVISDYSQLLSKEYF